MHKVFAIAFAGVVATSLTACQNKQIDGPRDGQITVDPSSLEFRAQGETKTVDVTGNNWEALPSESWIEVTKADGKIAVTVGANEADEAREGSITVKNADDTKIVSVTQTADAAISVDPEELSFTAAGETKTVGVTSKLAWTANTEENWIAVEKAESSFTVTVGENGDAAPRTGSITVDNGKNSTTVTVTQDAGESKEIIVQFTEGDLGFYWDYYKVGASKFEIKMVDAEGEKYLYLDILTPVIPNMMDAELPNGTYNYNATSYAEFTFAEKSFMAYIDENGKEQKISFTGGNFTSSHTGFDYSIRMEIELADGKTLKGTYEGELSVWPNPGRDLEINFNDIAGGADVSAGEYFDGTGVWLILLSLDRSTGGNVYLLVNGSPGQNSLPTGRFPMATASRKFVAGTAEPTSMYDDEPDLGCGWYIGGMLPAVPGKGFVDIQKTGNSEYAITFEFEGHHGYAARGSYSGYVEGGEVIEGEFKLTEGLVTYWGDSGKGTGDYTLIFNGERGSEIYIADAYTDLMNDPDNYKIPAGTYTYKDNSNNAKNTFRGLWFKIDGVEYTGNGGTFTLSYDGEATVINFDLRFKEDNYSLQIGYKGVVEYDRYEEAPGRSVSRAPKLPRKSAIASPKTQVRNLRENPWKYRDKDFGSMFGSKFGLK